MRLLDDYRYTLRLGGAPDTETLARFYDAFEKTSLIDYMDQASDDPTLFTSDAVQGNGGLEEAYIMRDLNELALQFPQFSLHFIAQNLIDRSYGYELKFEGDMVQRAEQILKRSEFTPPIPYNSFMEVHHQARALTEKKYAQVESFFSKTDFSLLHTQKELLEAAVHHDSSVPKETLDGLIHFLNTVCDLGESLGYFQRNKREQLIPLQSHHEKTEEVLSSTSSADKNTDHVYMLLEEHEDDDAIRAFNILAASKDKSGLQKLMRAKIEKDEYGYIAENGIRDESDDYFSTEYEAGFVEYYISRCDILDRNAIEQLLQTSEYDPVFHGPDNLKEIVTAVVTQYAAENGYRGLKAYPVVNDLLESKDFHAYLKKEGWASKESIPESSLPLVMKECMYYLDELLDEDPDYFVTTGGLTPISYPDNLKEILTDSVYIVARDHHLPVKDPDDIVNKILLDPEFQSVCRSAFADISHLTEKTELYQSAVWTCYDHVLDVMVPEHPKTKHPAFEEQIHRARSIRDEQITAVPATKHQQKENKSPNREDDL